jgi:IS5 family transposase
MFKALILQAQHNLSDAKMEFMIRDRLSWMRFLSFDLGGPTPDENTIRLFRNKLTETGALQRVMKAFDWQLQKKGYIPMSGQIVDASLVPAPKQRNTDAEKEAIKAGKTANEIWPNEPNKAAQKDTDARWTLKIGGKIRYRPDGTPLPQIALPVFGYKSHIAIDRRFGFIREGAVTSAAHADGRMLPKLVNTDNTSSEVWADSAYRSQKSEKWLASKMLVSRSIVASRRASRCRRISRGPMPRNRRSVPMSNTSSPIRKTGSACLSAPSGWRGPKRNSPWPISPPTSTVSSSMNGQKPWAERGGAGF